MHNPSPSNAYRGALHWIVLAVATLVLAGALALALVIGRMPGISDLIADPRFFRRALVVHVVLSLWGWFMAYAAGLRSLVDGASKSPMRRLGRVVATAGVGAMVVSAFIPGAKPLLVNYIPVVDHPVFLSGLTAFFVGVAVELCRTPTMAPSKEPSVPAASTLTWRATTPVALVALVVFALSLGATPRTMGSEAYYELLFWGVGHTLQVVSVLVMMGAWYYLLCYDTGRAPVGTKVALGLAAALIAPWFLAPMLVLGGTADATYLRGFTRMMQFGIAGPVLIAIALCVPFCLRRAASKAGKMAFLTSALLTLVGFGLGAMIRGSDTMIPAHYHASLGAITVALMALTYALLRIPGWTPPQRWWPTLCRWQPVVFGVGQLVFAAGFAISGLFGVDRKSYGQEQIIDSTGALVGLTTMGIGGLMAVVGGAGFIALIAVVCTQRINQWRRI